MKALCVITGTDIIAEAARLGGIARQMDCQRVHLVLFCANKPETSILKDIPVERVTVYCAQIFSPHLLAVEQVLSILEHKTGYDIYLFSGDAQGNEMAVRLSVRMGGSCVADAEKLARDGEGLKVIRGAFSQNLKAEYLLEQQPWCVGVSALCVPDGVEQGPKPTVALHYMDLDMPDWLEDVRFEPGEDQSWEKDTEVIIAAGRGVGGKQGVEILETLAGLLGGVLGGSRPAVMDGWLPLDRVIGMSGKTVLPRLCLCFGIAGSTAFLTGVEGSGQLVAVNSDPQASIFRVSDICVCEDWRLVAEELIRLLKEEQEHD